MSEISAVGSIGQGTSRGVGQSTAEPSGGCCDTTTLSSCCEPAAKGGCCGAPAEELTAAPSTCGCS